MPHVDLPARRRRAGVHPLARTRLAVRRSSPGSAVRLLSSREAVDHERARRRETRTFPTDRSAAARTSACCCAANSLRRAPIVPITAQLGHGEGGDPIPIKELRQTYLQPLRQPGLPVHIAMEADRRVVLVAS